MGFCVNCKYHTTEGTTLRNPKRKDFGRYTEEYEEKSGFIFAEKHFCTKPEFCNVDYVTGKTVYADCYKKNSFEACVFFDDGTVTDDVVQDDTSVTEPEDNTQDTEGSDDTTSNDSTDGSDGEGTGE